LPVTTKNRNPYPRPSAGLASTRLVLTPVSLLASITATRTQFNHQTALWRDGPRARPNRKRHFLSTRDDLNCCQTAKLPTLRTESCSVGRDQQPIDRTRLALFQRLALQNGGILPRTATGEGTHQEGVLATISATRLPGTFDQTLALRLPG